MEVGRSVPGRARGGEGIPAPRIARARLIAGLGSLACLGGAAAYGAASGGHLAPVAQGAAGAGVLLLLVALVFRWPGFVPWAVLGVGSGYLVQREGHATVDGWAAGVGVLLLVAAELASWSIEHDARVESERALVLRRALTLAGLAVVALGVNFVLLGAAGVSSSAGLIPAMAGVAAAVTALAVVGRLVRRQAGA